MADQSVGPTRHQTSQSRADPEEPDRDAGNYGVIPNLRVRPRERNPKNDQMLQDVDPVCDRERGCQEKEDYQFCRGDAEQEEIGKPPAKHFRNVQDHLIRRTAL